MTNFEYIQAMPQEDFVEFINKYCCIDDSPWTLWFDDKYCKNCPSLIDECNGKSFAWCESHRGCMFFPDLGILTDKDILIMWLKQKKEEGVFDV